MSVQFAANKLRVPAGFSTLLESLATEVLRQQPADIVAFGSHYFNQLLTERQSTGKLSTFKSTDIEERIYGDSYFGTASKKYRKTTEEIFSGNEYEVAAVKIQTAYRGHTGRTQARAVKNKKNKAATKIQAQYRGHRVRKNRNKFNQNESEPVKDLEEKQMFNDKEYEVAAVKIQTAYRGHAGRTKATKDKAATKIQARYRGYHVRKYYKKKSSESLHSESDVKEKSNEEFGEDEIRAAGIIQQKYRKHRSVKAEKEEIRKQDLAAVKIQRSYRGYRSRKVTAPPSEDIKPGE
uniref:RIIa domain-containing protein n=1 Tax=Ciona savignyi TaxID=51511 RepID=H2YJY1_CIOSA